MCACFANELVGFNIFLNPRNPTVLCTLLNSSQENTQQPGGELIFLPTIFGFVFGHCLFQEHPSSD